MPRQLTISRGGVSIPLIYGEGTTGAFDDLDADVKLGSSPGLWGAPPSRYREDVLVGLPGSRITTVTHQARDIVLPITVRADVTGEVDEILSRFMQLIDPVVSDERIRLTYTSPYGAESDRHIDAVLIAGQTGLVIQSCESRSAKFAIALRAEDPYWKSAEQSEVLALGSGADGWDIATWDSAVWGPAFAESFDTNTGETGGVATWPVWQVDGPCTSFVVRNGDEFLHFTDAVLAGQALKITTDPAARSVLVNADDRYAGLSVYSTFWSFPPAAVTPYIIGIEGVTAATQVSVSWSNKWLTCS